VLTTRDGWLSVHTDAWAVRRKALVEKLAAERVKLAELQAAYAEEERHAMASADYYIDLL
jgi:hypothetical protein